MTARALCQDQSSINDLRRISLTRSSQPSPDFISSSTISLSSQSVTSGLLASSVLSGSADMLGQGGAGRVGQEFAPVSGHSVNCFQNSFVNRYLNPLCTAGQDNSYQGNHIGTLDVFLVQIFNSRCQRNFVTVADIFFDDQSRSFVPHTQGFFYCTTSRETPGQIGDMNSIVAILILIQDGGIQPFVFCHVFWPFIVNFEARPKLHLSEPQSALFLNCFERANWQLFFWMRENQSSPLGMLKHIVASFYAHQLPAVLFEKLLNRFRIHCFSLRIVMSNPLAIDFQNNVHTIIHTIFTNAIYSVYNHTYLFHLTSASNARNVQNVQSTGLQSLLNNINKRRPHATRACFLLLMAGRSGSPSGRSFRLGSTAILLRPVTSQLQLAVSGITQTNGGSKMPYEKAHPESLYSVSERKITDLEKQLDEVAVVSEALYLVKSSVQDMVDTNKADLERLSAASFAMGIFQTNLNNAVKVSFSLLDTMRVTPKRGAPKKTIENNPTKG